MTIGVAMLLMTNVYAHNNAFYLAFPPEVEELPAEGERFVTGVKIAETEEYGFSFYEGEVIVKDEQIMLDGEGKLTFGEFEDNSGSGLGEFFIQTGKYKKENLLVDFTGKVN